MLVASEDNYVRIYTHSLKFLNRVLGRLGLMFAGAFQVRNESYMDEQAVFLADFQGYLTNGFHERLGFNVADSAAYFGYDNVGSGRSSDSVDKILDFVCDVRNHLNRGTEVLSAALFVKNIPVYFSRGQVRIFTEIFVDETLVMTQVKISLRSVLGYEYFSVLKRAHGSRIHIDIRIQLLSRNFKSSGFQESSQGRGGDTFTQSRYDSACNKNIFSHKMPPVITILSYDRKRLSMQKSIPAGQDTSPGFFV